MVLTVQAPPEHLSFLVLSVAEKLKQSYPGTYKDVIVVVVVVVVVVTGCGWGYCCDRYL